MEARVFWTCLEYGHHLLRLGARCVSVGSWLTMTAVAAAADAAVEMRDSGSFGALRAPAGISDWLAG